MHSVLGIFCSKPSVIVPAGDCPKDQFCCYNPSQTASTRPRPPPTQPTRPPTRQTQRPFLPTTTQAPDYREECPGSCIVSLLSFTCFRNAEMTDLFKCAKSGTTCCAPKSRIHEVQGLMMRNDTYPGFVNPQNQQQPPQYLAHNNYPPQNNYPAPPFQPNAYQPQQMPNIPANIPPNAYPPVLNPVHNYPTAPQLPNNYAPHPVPNYAPIPSNYPTQPAVVNYPVQPNNYPVQPNVGASNNSPVYSTPAYEIPTQPPTTPTTTTIRSPVYSKYVCGVKGTSRTSRKLFLERIKPLHLHEQNVANVRTRRNVKSSERLVLGSELVPIEIGTDKLGDFAREHDDESNAFAALPEKKSMNLPHIVYNTNYTNSYRQARVVGGEDGENGEWCWQVALINSMNQYLCGAALIGTQWVLTAAHCVTK